MTVRLDKYRKTVLRYAALSGLASVLIVFTVILFALVASANNISVSGLRNLYAAYGLFYFLNLLPLAAVIAGAWYGRKVFLEELREEKEKEQYENTLSRTVKFVDQIRRNNLNTPFVAVNGEKVLEEALESMRKSLIESAERDAERSEINRLSSELSLLLQSFTDTEKLSQEVLSFLVNKIDNVVQGAFYLTTGENGDEEILEMKSCYAYGRRKHLQASFRFAEGLVGQAAVERDYILRTEIPAAMMTVRSGLLGDLKPGCILLNPLISDEKVYGVVELGSFTRLTPHQVELVKTLSRQIARTVANVKINQRTYNLLQESEKMSSELRYQKQQLVLNAEDLIKTRDELRKSNLKLEEQIQEVHNTAKRTQVLLENAREIILIFSENFRTVYVSPSIKAIMGYFPEELVGKDETENIHPLDTDHFRQLLKNIKSFPEKEISLQYRYFTKEGEVKWMEATGKNLLSDPVIKGIVINTRDISEQRKAVKEQRMRAKMQALSENSSDIIIRIDIFSRCTYINPAIEEYTGVGKDGYINKSLSAISLDPSVTETLKRLLGEVSQGRTRKTEELVFPTNAGNQVMSLNAIPEFSENGDTESVLFVCHNITEAKAREEIIRKKNKSISDSINYAFNIQSALMPTEEILQRVLPNSFMFYKPKDVVSGDYPWMFRHGDSVYVGAMDCTGHGVPGALMSIIGYFLQTAIVENKPGLNAGEVLNLLHSSVVTTLKQAEPGSKINDGMDAAVVRVDLRKRELDYAGAHRPLFHTSKGVLNEIKADKYPVGSTQYRNRKEFTNHTLKLKQGDAIYFMTDGYTDQFGGPDGKKKFSGDRVAEMIRENQNLSIFQMGSLFRNSYEEWKGANNQIDDVLVIGIKF